MKFSIATLIVAIGAVNVLAGDESADVKTQTVQVETFKDYRCSESLEKVTLEYRDNACLGICSIPKEYRSYRVLTPPPKKPSFLFVTAYAANGAAPCFSTTAFNTTNLDGNIRPCIRAPKIDDYGGSFRLESSGP